jgi:hypothetical protein
MQTTGNLGLKKPEGTDIVDIADLNGNMDILDTTVNNKVDKVTGKQLSTNDYTTAEKTKLAGIAAGATNYTHPATHPPSIIAQDTSNRFVTDAEKAAWNGKAPNTLVSGAPQNDGLMRATDKLKLDGISAGANNYVHPATHPATMITEDATHRFATDTEKSNWNSKSNLVTTPQQTTADITYYVRTDGSDSNLGNSDTAAGAFKTITKALSLVPQIVNHDVKIIIRAGAYAESVILNGLIGYGLVSLLGQGVVTVTNVAVNQCTNVLISGFTATLAATGAAYAAKAGGYVKFDSCTTTVAGNIVGFNIAAQSGIVSNCVISNKANAIAAQESATVFASANTGVGNNYAMVAAQGSKITVHGTTPNANTPAGTYDAGIVQTGFVVNPWGDSTSNSRSFISAWANTPDQLAASTWTKLTFGNVVFDYLGEFSGTTNRFTAAQNGIYLVSASISLTTPGINSVCTMSAYVNGSRGKDFGYTQTAGTLNTGYQGSVVLRLKAGDYIEIFANSNIAVGIPAGNSWKYIDIIRVA